MPALEQDLVSAHKILSNEDVMDMYGHVSARHPDHDDRILISLSQSPRLVEEGDFLEMTLDGELIDADGRRTFKENVIHRAIYRNRDDVNCVVHAHPRWLIPFSVTGVEIKPITHNGAAFHDGVPTFSDYDEEGGRLIVTEDESERMADQLGDRVAQLIEGHGVNVVGGGVRETVVQTMYLIENAKRQLMAENLGEPRYYTDPMEDDLPLTSSTIKRNWDYWASRVP